MLNPTILSQYLAVLTELVKEESPTLYVEDFLYYYNKAISEYMKLRYEKFGITQQVTDDLRAWIVTYETDSLETNMLELHNNLIAECKEYVQTEIGSKKCT
ncbi:MAG: hypothetical protein KAH32_06315, partial [Chlamydiia bacterium]|nr:hypothetical protein [Chlamydiia bacterium]